MRYRIDFTTNLVLGPNSERQQGNEGTYYIYDIETCDRMCYATNKKYVEIIQEALESVCAWRKEGVK